MMNILILSGSPRKKGLVSQMLDIMREEGRSGKKRRQRADNPHQRPEYKALHRLYGLSHEREMRAWRRRFPTGFEDDAGGGCHHHRSAMLLGKYPGTDEATLRPYCIWYDARHPTIPRASYEGQEMYPSQHLYHPLALEYLVQSVTWCYSCSSRDMPLFRFQDCCHNRAWRYCNASSAIGKRQEEMPQSCY